MKNFVIKNLLFLAGVAIISLGLLAYKVSTENPYSILFHLKNQKLASIFNQPKIIIIGGSNARYGFNSEFLEKKYGRPVINTAITYHQGLPYYLEWSKMYLKEGDWVIISPEYALTNSSKSLLGTYQLIDVAYENEYFMKFLQDNPKVLKNQLSQSHMILNKILNNITNREIDKENLLASHNTSGDAIERHGKSENFAATTIVINKPCQDYYQLIHQYASYCQQKKIKLFLTFPPVRKESLELQTNTDLIVEKIQNEIPGILMLNTPEDTIYPDSLFYDSPYHLNAAGKELHTQKVSAAISGLIQSDNYGQTLYTQNNSSVLR